MNMPQILQQLQNQGPLGNLGQIKQMVQMFKSMGNPQAMISQMAQNNPQVAQLINQAGGDPRKAFYDLAQRKGINPDEILSMLK